MATRAYFTLLADYNAWANARLYDAAAELSDADYRKKMGAFFGSLHNTLNHILVGDRIWFSGLRVLEMRRPRLMPCFLKISKNFELPGKPKTHASKALSPI
jgi:hypothetical protein